MMPSPIRVALAGGDATSRLAAECYRDDPRFRLVCLLAPVGSPPAALAGPDCPRLDPDEPDAWRGLLGREQIDMIELGHGITSRASLLRHAVAVRLPVVISGPLALSEDEAAAMTAGLAQGDARATVLDPLLAHPFVGKAREALRREEIGEFQEIRVKTHLGACTPTPSGNPLNLPVLEVLPLIEFLAGPIEEVHAYGSDAALMCALRLAGPCRYGVLEAVHSPGLPIFTDGPRPVDNRIELTGTDGILWLENLTALMIESPRYRLKRKSTTVIEDESVDFRPPGLARTMRHEAARLLFGQRPDSSLETARRALRLLTALTESRRAGRPVKTG